MGLALGYRATTIGELQHRRDRQDTHLRPVRHHLGISAFGTAAWTAANEGDRLMPEHQEEAGNEELYVVLSGHARFEIDGDTVEAPQGMLVFVRPESKRTAFAEEAGTTVSRSAARRGGRTRSVAGSCGRSSNSRSRPATTTR